jgi:PKHD-type hydroxylase
MTITGMASEVQLVGEANRWVSLIGLLDASTCAEIIDLCMTCPSTTPDIVGTARLPAHRVGRMRRVERAPATTFIYDVLWELGCLVNDQHFHLDLSAIVKAPEYVEYTAEAGHFHWHNDYGLERPISRRKLTLSIQLSDGVEYTGGDFEVFGAPDPLPRGIGSVIALPAYVHHRITPVRSGMRRALVAWLAGPALR